MLRHIAESKPSQACHLPSDPDSPRANSLNPTCLQILGKAEFLNPGGSVKDRVALQIIEEAFASRKLKASGLVTEGTVGSTGVSLAMVAAARGVRCFIAMPDDAAIEKSQTLEALGAAHLMRWTMATSPAVGAQSDCPRLVCQHCEVLESCAPWLGPAAQAVMLAQCRR